MRQILNGQEVFDVSKNKIFTIFFDNNHLYIAAGNLPVLIKNVSKPVIEQIGIFLRNYGKDPTHSPFRLDVPSADGPITFKFDKVMLYIIQEKLSYILHNISLSEIRQLGVWLMKASKEIGN